MNLDKLRNSKKPKGKIQKFHSVCVSEKYVEKLRVICTQLSCKQSDFVRAALDEAFAAVETTEGTAT